MSNIMSLELKNEIERIKGYFDENQKSIPFTFYKDRFDNSNLDILEFPNIKEFLDECMPEGFYEGLGKNTSKYPATINPGEICIQWHRCSIEEHTDYVSPSEYFQMIVLELPDPFENELWGWARNPAFYYYDEFGKKNKNRIKEKEIITFNPSKKHEMIFYGQEYLVAMRSIFKVKKKMKDNFKPNVYSAVINQKYYEIHRESPNEDKWLLFRYPVTEQFPNGMKGCATLNEVFGKHADQPNKSVLSWVPVMGRREAFAIRGLDQAKEIIFFTEYGNVKIDKEIKQ